MAEGEISKIGRPGDYTEELAAQIIAETANTTDSLKRICERNPDFPDPRTIRRWIVEKEEFRHKYARAKEEQADVMAEEITDIADELVLNKSELTHEQVGAARLRVDARKWAAAKLKPKKYGAGVEMEGGIKIRVGFIEDSDTGGMAD